VGLGSSIVIKKWANDATRARTTTVGVVVRATSHTRLRARDHYTSSTLIGGKVEPVQVCFTLRLRDQWSMWMQDGCKSLHGVLHGIKWIMFHGHLDCFQKPPLGGSSNTKPGDHGTPNTHNHWFILIYHVWGPAWILFIDVALVESPVTYGFTMHLMIHDHTT
jgi:hypothetical protein